MTTRRFACSFLAALAALLSLVPMAAATDARPAWKVVAATGPTNLPPTQSEVQKLTIGGEGGTFSLSRKAGEGLGTPKTINGQLALSQGAETATALSGTFEAGERVTASGFIPTETTITAVNGSEVSLSRPAEATGNKLVKIFTKQIGSLTGGPFHPGEVLSGAGIAPGTTVIDVESGVLTTDRATNAEYSVGQISLTASEVTASLSVDAEASEVQSALEALPSLGAGAISVSGGPGGEAARPYFISFDGSAFADQDVEQLEANGEGLTGAKHYASIFTTIPGGAGTGAIGIFAVNVGGAEAGGGTKEITVHLGPLPEGLVVSGKAEGSGWSCVTAGGREVTCETANKVGPRSAATQIGVPVEVKSTAAPNSAAQVTISGGGVVEPASFLLPIRVSTEDAQPGAAAFWAGAFEADGTPARQAGGHPDSALTYFVLNTVRSLGGRPVPAGESRDITVDIPPGFVGNPMVTARCPQSLIVPIGNFEKEPNPSCNSEYAIGSLNVFNTLTGLNHELGFNSATYVYNNVPPKGYAAAFTTKIVGPLQTLLASVRSEEDFGIRILAPNNATAQEKLYKSFAVLRGAPSSAHGKAFLTMQSDCAEEAREPRSVEASFDTWQEPGRYFHAKAPQPPITGCAKLQFKGYDPQTGQGQVKFGLQPTSTQGSSPVGLDAHLHIDQSGLINPDELATPDLKRSAVKLPQGLVLNPSQANGLEACSEAQIGYIGEGKLPNPTRFDDGPATCPDGSKLGTAEVVSPLLEEPLDGTIYLARQDENPFHTLIGLYLVLESPRFGLTLKLPGKVVPDPSSGQLTATFDYLPQQPIEDLALHFRGGGPRSELATPEVCGSYSTDGEWEPWSAPESGSPAITHDRFTVASNCAHSAATRPFSPSFEAGTGNPIAGAYAPLVIKVGRNDGEQELRSLDFSLPAGVSGKLAGIPYCSDAQIVAAERKTGRAEQAQPSCPAASQLGTVDTAAGVGPAPFHVEGHAYLAGPYKGAPVSSVVITPAVAGPFDLGDVVIRAPVYVNPESAQLTAKSDPIPTILKGIPLKVRSVVINIDRSQFGINPTNCEVMAATASIGSSNGATAKPANRFQVGGCENLRFKPKLQVKLKGGTRRNAKPALTAILRQAPGQANIRFTSVALPHSEFLEQGHIKTICTRVQFAAQQCPKGSIYGRAEAVTPLLDQPLRGPVYLRSSSHRLPDMVVALRGPATQPIEIDLDGRIDSIHGGIRTTFEAVPDAPVSKFVLRMRGGKKSLIVNSTNICRGKHKATVRMTGQNGRPHNFRTRLKAQCGKKARKHKKRKAHHRKGAAKHKPHAKRGKK